MFVLDADSSSIHTHGMVYSPTDPSMLISVGEDGVKIWDLNKQALRRALKNTPRMNCLAISPNGKQLAGCQQHFGSQTKCNILTYTVPGGRTKETISTPFTYCNYIQYSPEGGMLAVSGTERRFHDGALRRWNLDTGKQRRAIEGHEGQIGVFGFSSDGRHLVTGGEDKLAHIWNHSSREQLATLKHPEKVWGACFSNDGSIVATVGGKNIFLWSVPKGKKLATLKGHSDTVFDLAISPDGEKLASASADKTVRFWSLSSKMEIAVYEWEVGELRNVAFSCDGMTAAVSSDSGKIVVWDVVD